MAACYECKAMPSNALWWDHMINMTLMAVCKYLPNITPAWYIRRSSCSYWFMKYLYYNTYFNMPYRDERAGRLQITVTCCNRFLNKLHILANINIWNTLLTYDDYESEQIRNRSHLNIERYVLSSFKKTEDT